MILIIRNIMVVALLISPTVTFAHTACPNLLVSNELDEPQHRVLSFRNVEVFRRNNGVGLQQKGNIEFERWIELSNPSDEIENFIGLTKEGRLYHLLQWRKSRQIARLLNGDQKFNDFYIYGKQIVVAVDMENTVHLYSPSKWLLSPVKETIKRGTKIWLATSATVTGVLALWFPEFFDLGPVVSSVKIPMAAAFVSVASAVNTFFVMVYRYDRLNTFPNGFVRTDLRLANVAGLKSELDRLQPEGLEAMMSASHFLPPNEDEIAPPLHEQAVEPIR